MGARTVLNFSDWRQSYALAPRASQSVLAREMPPRSYRMAHPEAQLTDAETQQLAKACTSRSVCRGASSYGSSVRW